MAANVRDSVAADILIFGAGGFGSEVAWLIDECTRDGDRVRMAGFIDDRSDISELIDGHPAFSLNEARRRFPNAFVVSAVGNPRARASVTDRVIAAGAAFATVIHPTVRRSASTVVGEGSVICAGSILTTNITVGRHVHINLNCTIGHNAVISDFVTLSPGVHVSGWVRLERGVFVGTGAVFVNGTEDAPIVVGEGAVVGAGACVTRSVSAGHTVVGVPARPLTRLNGDPSTSSRQGR